MYKILKKPIYRLPPPPSERPLQVLHHLEDVEVKENAAVTLSCSFAPSPRAVRWFRGRTALKSSTKYSMRREGPRAELTIHGLLGMDGGPYHCMAGGSQSTATVKVEGRTYRCLIPSLYRYSI